MKRRKLVRGVVEAGVLALLHLAGIHAMARWRVMESLLAPGGHDSRLYVALAAGFLFVRFSLFFLAPGWLAARAYFCCVGRGQEKVPGEKEAAIDAEATLVP